MIDPTFDVADKAASFIRDNARAYGEAKATRRYLEEYRKSLKSMLRKDGEGTVQDKDDYAYSHKDYLDNLKALKIAITEEETLLWQLKAAEIKSQNWRTWEASARTTDRAHR